MKLSPAEWERFEAKIAYEPMSGCWLWAACVDRPGYGRFGLRGGTRPAHRIAYEHLVGPIPPGLTIDHLCRQRCCVNPEHMEPVSRGENVLRGESLSAQRARQKRCRRGHSFSRASDGRRYCRACKALADAARWRKGRP